MSQQSKNPHETLKNQHIEDLNNSEKIVVEIIENVSFLIKLFKKEMEVSIDQRNRFQKFQSQKSEVPQKAEEPQLQDTDNIMDVEEVKGDMDSFPDLFDGEDDEINSSDNSSESLIVKKLFSEDNANENKLAKSKFPSLVEPRNIDLVSNDQVEFEINDTVEKISDSVIWLTKNLHEIADDINIRYNIYQQQPPDAIWKKISFKDVKEICSDMI